MKKVLQFVAIGLISSCTEIEDPMQPTESGRASTSPYFNLPQVEDVTGLSKSFPNMRPVGSPDQRRMDRAVQRLLAQQYDCPEQMLKSASSTNRVLVTARDQYNLMSESEKSACDAEGDARAIGRIQQRLNELPKLLSASMDSASAYLTAREKLKASQCDADLDAMREARYRFSLDHSKTVLSDEDFYWDLSRLATSSLIDLLDTTIVGNGFTLKIDGLADGSQAPGLKIEAAEHPEPASNDLKWSTRSFVVADKYGPPSVNISQIVIEVLVPEIGLDPLPIKTHKIEASWEREPHGNVSVGDYRGAWMASEGYEYCRHEIDVWSDNNVCDNTIEVTSRGVSVKATLKSGSKYVDGWRGWLRFRGNMTTIQKTATSCQSKKALCRAPFGTAQLVKIDPICKMGPGSNEEVEYEDLCFREGPIGREMCHYGTIGATGRCRVTKTVACPN